MYVEGTVGFKAEVGLHQGSALSPFWFTLVIQKRPGWTLCGLGWFLEMVGHKPEAELELSGV